MECMSPAANQAKSLSMHRRKDSELGKNAGTTSWADHRFHVRGVNPIGSYLVLTHAYTFMLFYVYTPYNIRIPKYKDVITENRKCSLGYM
jgi:hypothetical protein